MKTKPSNNPPTNNSRRLVSFIPLPAKAGNDGKLLKLEVQVSLVNNIRPTLAKDEDRDLLDLWQEVKGKIRDHSIQNHQVTKWFEAVYHTSVNLVDFDRDLPPAKLSKERLLAFYNAIKRHTASSE